MDLNRRDAKTPRENKGCLTRRLSHSFSSLFPFFLALCLCVSAVNLSCSSKPIDLRTLVPAETLVYLETNDLAAALQPIVDSKPFTEVAKSKPDFSALKGVQLAVAVTGFETSEEKLTDEHSVGRVQPHFVAIADTHAWNFQAVGFAEKKLGAFVENIYDSVPTVEKSDKNGGKYFIWTAKDGRKAYALVMDSIIYFGNDETAIDKCLAVKQGEADSIIKTGKVQPADPATLASGYVSIDGIAQIANIASLQFASQSSDDSEVQSAIAGILPQLLRSSITEISWAATKTEQGIEDKYKIGMPPEIANVFSETMTPGDSVGSELPDYLPQGARTASVYSFRNPRVAWRSLLVLAQKQLPPSTGSLIGPFSSALFEPYGISDPDHFLSSVGPAVATANDAEDGDKPIVVTPIVNAEDLKASVAKDAVTVKGHDQPVFDEGIIGVSYLNGRVHVGDANTVVGAVAKETVQSEERKPYLKGYLSNSTAPITTYSYDNKIAVQIRDMFRIPGGEDDKAGSVAITETRFTRSGMERRTLSDFGLIGSIIAQLAQN